MQEAVLLASDSHPTRRLVADVFSPDGYEFPPAESGPQTLRLAAELMPSAIIVDAAISDGTSEEICKRIRRERRIRDTPIVVASTAELTPDDRVNALLAGADDSFGLPNEAELLRTSIKRLLNRRHGWSEVPYALAKRTREILANAKAASIVWGKYAFASYSSKDEEAVLRRINALERSGINCWFYKRDIHPGKSPQEEVAVGINGCFALYLFLSRNTPSSFYVSKELDIAWACQKTLIPIRIDDTPIEELREKYPILSSYQILDWKSGFAAR